MTPAARFPLALIALVGLAACSGDDDTPTTTVDDTASDAGTASGGDATTGAASTDDDASAMWRIDEVVIEENDLWNRDDRSLGLRDWRLFAGAPTIAIADSGDGHVALRSDDGVSFRPVHRGCCGTTVADRLDDRAVVASVAPGMVSAFASDDAGASWTAVDLALPGGAPDAPIPPGQLLVTGEGYLVTGSSPPGAAVPVLLWRSPDLVDWTPIGFDELGTTMPEGSYLRLVRGVDVVWVVAVLESGTDAERVVPFRTFDGGTTFEAMPVLDARVAHIAAVADRLVAWPSELGPDASFQPSPWVLVPGAGWVRAPIDNGQWGDAAAVRSSTLDPATGRLTAVVARSLRSSAEACFEDPDGCGDGQIALVTSPDGLAWRDVTAPTWTPPETGTDVLLPALGAPGPNAVLVWQPDADGGVTAHLWTGPSDPPTVDPPEYEIAASSPFRMYERGPIEIGETVRINLPFGGCTRTYVDDRYWDSTPPIPEPAPADWPFRPSQEIDGATGTLSGLLTRVGDGEMTFVMPGPDVTLTLTTSDRQIGGCVSE